MTGCFIKSFIYVLLDVLASYDRLILVSGCTFLALLPVTHVLGAFFLVALNQPPPLFSHAVSEKSFLLTENQRAVPGLEESYAVRDSRMGTRYCFLSVSLVSTV